MAEKTSVTFKIDKDVKDRATGIFQSLGMNFTTGLDVYLRAVIRTGGIPFDLHSGEVQPPSFSLAERTHGAKDIESEINQLTEPAEHSYDR